MTLVIVLAVLAAVILAVRAAVLRWQADRQRKLDDAAADARRWIERLGGQVLTLTGTDTASQQALADAAERYNAAASQVEQAESAEQARLATETALEGLYYIRAARVAMDMDPGPALPDEAERERAGKVTEHRQVDVDGQAYAASPEPGQDTPHYYPGGEVAGRPVPQGWYSEPWWKPALIGGAWGLGAAVLFGAMFAGMPGVADASTWQDGYDAGQHDVGFDDDGAIF
ncbi:hypothetical protein [Amycolatopsis saalfeldensis]|uniref:DUF1542 domain-containing protein n=1 Tax=Amycolatopsis saalfeldensis TaxID=394193 RepID=A0A1H8Y9U1_9PSEU|nr:hypothetical protein [Amycolatopsis saalfeldensis]SEP49040.1 hypothetical protein SAMN04489732_112246 [Amycolatopsis saalfeldensis]